MVDVVERFCDKVYGFGGHLIVKSNARGTVRIKNSSRFTEFLISKQKKRPKPLFHQELHQNIPDLSAQGFNQYLMMDYITECIQKWISSSNLPLKPREWRFHARKMVHDMNTLEKDQDIMKVFREFKDVCGKGFTLMK